MQNEMLLYRVGTGAVGMMGGDACVVLVEACIQVWRDESVSWCHPDLTFVILSASEESRCLSLEILRFAQDDKRARFLLTHSLLCKI